MVRTRSTSASPFFSCLAQAEYVVGAHAIVAAKRPQMPDGHFVYAILVARIDLLRRAQHFRDGRLLQVSVFAQFAQDFPVLFQRITPKKVEETMRGALDIYAKYGVLYGKLWQWNGRKALMKKA